MSRETRDFEIDSSRSTPLKAVKSVKFGYSPTLQVRELLKTFRDMVNDAIRICLEEDVRGRLKLRDRIYKEFLRRHEVVSCYPYSVAEVAWSIVKKHRKWHRPPRAKRLMLKVDASNYSLNYAILSLPFKKGQRLLLPLQYGDYQRSYLMNDMLKRGSITLTENSVIITFSKLTSPYEPVARIGYDLNEKSLVGSDGTRVDLSEVARLHTEYGVRRSQFSHEHSQDFRLRKKYSGSRREKERVKQFLHRIAKHVVEVAKERKQAVILERLKGIRVAHQRGNGEGRRARRRIAQWPFWQLQNYIRYSAVWVGVPVKFVNPRGTSQECHVCHYVNTSLKLGDRSWQCPQCGCQLDREFNAAINIERRGKIVCLGEVRPEAQGTDEAVKGNPTTPVILRAEALKPFELED